VRGLAHADEFGRDLVDLAVQRLVEMRGLQEVGDAVEGVVVDEDGAQKRLLSLDVVRRLAIEGSFRLAEFYCRFRHCLQSFARSLPYQTRLRTGANSTFLYRSPQDGESVERKLIDSNRDAILAACEREQNQKIG